MVAPHLNPDRITSLKAPKKAVKRTAIKSKQQKRFGHQMERKKVQLEATSLFKAIREPTTVI